MIKELTKHLPEITATLRAEELAAQFVDQRGRLTSPGMLKLSPISEVWQWTAFNEQIVALFSTARLMSNFQAFIAEMKPGDNAVITLLAPGSAASNTFASAALGNDLPGWQLAVSFKGIAPFEIAGAQRTALYLWTGIVALGMMVLLSFMAIHLSRRHMAIARLKSDLAATVSHELKTPLSSMRVLVDTLLESDATTEQTRREYLHLIAQENDRLSRLIENFLCFSRLERNRWPFQFESVRVGELVERVVQSAGARLQAANCRFEVQVEPNLPDVRGDREALSTALLNLLDNASKYSSDPKNIVFIARAQNGDVVLSVQDNGIGISPRHIKKIFRPFYQVDSSLSRSCGGFGLGLSIVQQIIQAHRGRAYVESEMGQGSSFFISLPASSQNQSNASAHCPDH